MSSRENGATCVMLVSRCGQAVEIATRLKRVRRPFVKPVDGGAVDQRWKLPHPRAHRLIPWFEIRMIIFMVF